MWKTKVLLSLIFNVRKERGDKPSSRQKRYAIIINYARYMYVITLTQPYTIALRFITIIVVRCISISILN